jgi:bifunctional UDP-N-acetylglucosamine pyrophosphorylase/glucosamine-1-phosphate N-acetyltransferase
MDTIKYAIVLAGGKSTRTYPLTLTKPKPLLKVRDKTIIEHNLDQLKGLVEEIVIVIGYKGKHIQEFLKDKYNGLKITYIKQKEQLGTGHALLQVRDKIKGRFIILNGDDIYSGEDIKECIKYNYCILAAKVSHPENFGVLTLDYNNCLKDIVEKPSEFISNLVNTGLYVIDDKIFKKLKQLTKTERGEFELTDAVKSIAEKEDVYCFTSTNYWVPVGYPADILCANELLLKRLKQSIKGVIEEGSKLNGKFIIYEGTVIERTVHLNNYVSVGKETTVKGIVTDSSIGNGCFIDEDCEIINSIVADNVKIESDVKIENAVISDNCVISKGSRLIGKNDNPIVLGENVFIAENNSLTDGAVIWPDKKTKKDQDINSLIK